MATKTTNLGLTKPDGTDKVLILVLNGNFDKIDEAIGAIRAQQIPAEVITAAVEAYMAEHEVASGATPEQASQIEANRTSIETLAQTVENLSAEDVGARPDTWMPTASDVGARPNTWIPSAKDVGAVPYSYVNQSLKTTDSVTFASVTANVVYGAVFME